MQLLGEDIFSNFAREEFRKCGVSPINLYKGNGIPLNVTSAMITSKDRTFMSYGHGSVEATDTALEEAYKMCTGAKIVIMHTGGFLPVYKKLKEEGTTLVFDCGWDDNLSLENYKEHIEIADYYTPNQKEALKISDTDTPEKAADVLSNYFENVIVKLDKNGCLGMQNGKKFYVSQVDDFKHKDSTGAGDAFLSGFIYGLYHEYSFEDAIKFGNITGGKCVTSVGCLSAYCTEKSFLKLKKIIIKWYKFKNQNHRLNRWFISLLKNNYKISLRKKRVRLFCFVLAFEIYFRKRKPCIVLFDVSSEIVKK